MTKEERREYQRAWYAANRERLLAKKKVYYAKNKRKCNLAAADYYARHREELRARAKKRYQGTKNSHGKSTE